MPTPPPQVSAYVAMQVLQYRKARNLTQGQLAQQCKQLGVPMSKYILVDIEKGRRKVTVDELSAFAQVFGVSMTQLLPPEQPATPLDHEGIQAALSEAVLHIADIYRKAQQGGD